MVKKRIYQLMDNYQAIAGGFQETIELITASVDRLAEPIQRASEACIEALLQEQKILCCGNGGAAAVAQLFSASLLHRFEHERPALPESSASLTRSTYSPFILHTRIML